MDGLSDDDSLDPAMGNQHPGSDDDSLHPDPDDDSLHPAMVDQLPGRDAFDQYMKCRLYRVTLEHELLIMLPESVCYKDNGPPRQTLR